MICLRDRKINTFQSRINLFTVLNSHEGKYNIGSEDFLLCQSETLGLTNGCPRHHVFSTEVGKLDTLQQHLADILNRTLSTGETIRHLHLVPRCRQWREGWECTSWHRSKLQRSWWGWVWGTRGWTRVRYHHQSRGLHLQPSWELSRNWKSKVNI